MAAEKPRQIISSDIQGQSALARTNLRFAYSINETATTEGPQKKATTPQTKVVSEISAYQSYVL